MLPLPLLLLLLLLPTTKDYYWARTSGRTTQIGADACKKPRMGFTEEVCVGGGGCGSCVSGTKSANVDVASLGKDLKQPINSRRDESEREMR